MDFDEAGDICDVCMTFKKPVLRIEGVDRMHVKICRRCTEEAARMWVSHESGESDDR